MQQHQHWGMKPVSRSSSADSVMSEITCACLLTRTHRISRVLTNIYGHELRPFGLNSHQFALLVTISRLGIASRATIGRFNHQDRSTLTRNLQIVFDEGWVAEVADAARGRSRLVALTEAGKAVLSRAAPAWRSAQEKAMSILGQSGVDSIIAIADDLPQAPAGE